MDKYTPSYAMYMYMYMLLTWTGTHLAMLCIYMYMYIPAHSLAIPQRLHLGSIIYLHVYCVAHR